MEKGGGTVQSRWRRRRQLGRVMVEERKKKFEERRV